MTQTQQAPTPHITWPPEHTPAASVVFAQNIVGIAASPDTVWSLLIDCARWPSWYKHCSHVSVIQGGSLLAAGSTFRFKTLDNFFEPVVVTFDPPRMLIWSAKGPFGTSGAHAWYIEPTASGCVVTTEETQKGALLYLLGSLMRKRILAAHEEWLRALKHLAEAA